MNNSNEMITSGKVASSDPEMSARHSSGSADSFADTSVKKPFRPALIISLVAVLLIGAGVGGFFLYRYLKEKSASETGEIEVATVYSTPSDSEDPAADYQNYLDSKKQKAKTTAEKLSVISQESEAYVMARDYDKALAVLDALNLDDYSDPEELYYIYSAYAFVYSPQGLNDEARCAEYMEKANAAAEAIYGEEN